MDSDKTQVIDLAALRGEPPRKPKREKLDLYEVTPDNMFGDTIPGLVRPNNEDSFACCSRPDGHLSMAVVADGISGSDGGELASTACIAGMVRSWRSFTAKYQDTTWENAQRFLSDTIRNVNSAICRDAAKRNVTMGTTVAALLFADRYAVIANAGDSCVYRLRDHQLELLSTEHTVAAEALIKGEITPEQLETFPFRHTITRAVGVSEKEKPQIRVTDHQPGDGYLLCSDGLTLHVPDEEIRREMDSCYEPRECVEHLIRTTLRGGARDNVTIISVFA